MKKILKLFLAGFMLTILASCATTPKTGVSDPTPFGKTADGQLVQIYTLSNTNGMEARIMTYGGTLVSLKVPDKKGNLNDVVLGFDSMESYLKNTPYFGVIVGRYANRIANGQFSLDGKEYNLAKNNHGNSLHGGLKGFDKVVWQARKVQTSYGPGLELIYVSKDGEEGFPGNLTVKVIYAVTQNNELICDMTATTDKHTVVNLTNHSYFNLQGQGNVLDYKVWINANKFTSTDKNSIPSGQLKPVANTPFDFRIPTAIGARINENNEQLKFANGYDQNFVLNKKPGELSLAAVVTEPTSDRKIEVWTTAPGIQFYTANGLDGTIGKHGQVYQPREAFCLEPGAFPDSPNHSNFPKADLKPGEIYTNTIIYKFSVAGTS